MKTITILFVSVLLFSSCQKCYDCETVSVYREICNGEPEYDYIKKNIRMTDQFGNEFKCK